MSSRMLIRTLRHSLKSWRLCNLDAAERVIARLESVLFSYINISISLHVAIMWQMSPRITKIWKTECM